MSTKTPRSTVVRLAVGPLAGVVLALTAATAAAQKSPWQVR